MKKKSQGNIMDLVTIGILILAVSIVMMTYLETTELMMKKLEISQISRKYILKMETEGYLSPSNKDSMLIELHDAGMRNVDITGTTMQPVTYGDTIMLQIKGALDMSLINNTEEIWDVGFQTRQIPLEEARMSTAKN